MFGLAIFVTVGQLPKLFGLKKGSGDTISQFVHLLAQLGSASWTPTAWTRWARSRPGCRSEALGAAQNFADKHGYQLDPSQDMIALGLANLGCWR